MEKKQYIDIKIKRLECLNFKGFRQKSFDVSNFKTLICGRNASGKSTIADAFYWCLFGQDAHQSSKLTVKRIEDGKEVLNEPHSVRLTLEVDGVEKIYERQLLEVWTRPTGTEEKTLTSHKSRCLINDCEVTCSAFDKEISTLICSKDMFYTLSNPAIFTALKTDQQRQMLFALSKVRLEDVAAKNKDYQKLLDELKGASLDLYIKEVKSRKRAINKELDTIPVAIEAIKNVMPEEARPAKDVEIELNAMRAGGQSNAAAKIASEIAEKVNQANALLRKEYDIAMRDYDNTRQLYDKARNAQALQRSRLDELIRKRDNQCKVLTDGKQTTEQFLEGMRAQFRQLQSTLIKGDCVCPITNRACIDQEANSCWEHNASNANAEINKKLSELNEKAKIIKADSAKMHSELEAEIEQLNNQIDELKATVDADEMKLAEIKADFEKLEAPKQPTTLTAVDIEDCKPLIAKANDLAKGDTSNTDAIRTLAEELERANQRERSQMEIDKFKDREKELQRQLCEIEKREYLSESLSNEFTDAIEAEINAKFKLVKFKLFEEQLNGGKNPTCTATIDGVRFADLNTAAKINAGIDIINVLSEANGVRVPVFIDNAEAVNELLPCNSQTFELRVTTDDLTITNL